MKKFFDWLRDLYYLWVTNRGIVAGYTAMEYLNFQEKWIPIKSDFDMIEASDGLPTRFVFANGKRVPLLVFNRLCKQQQSLLDKAALVNPEAYANLMKDRERYYAEAEKTMEHDWPFPEKKRRLDDDQEEWPDEDFEFDPLY